MEIAISEFGSTAKKITLVGKLDIVGAEAIEVPLSALADEKRNVIVDMIGVDFIASVGIRRLVKASKAVRLAAAKLVLLNPSPMVTDVLQISGVTQILPIVRSEDEALAVFGGARA